MSKPLTKKRKISAFPKDEKFQVRETLSPVTLIDADAEVQTGATTQDYILYFIFLFGFISTIGSLYYGAYGDPVANILAGQLFPRNAGFPPCELCWVARILMYPITVISFVGLLKEDKHFTDYILPLSGVGIFLEIFHYGLQKWNFPNPFQCTNANPCSALQVQYLGFVTIPLLALIGFTFVTVLCIWNWRINRAKK